MAFINDSAFDAALNYIRDGVNTSGQIDICSQEPVTFTEARTTYTLGDEVIASANVSAVADGTTDGRRITMLAVNDGDVSGTGTASHWAVSNATVLLATGSLSASQSVTSGNKFTLGAFDITIRDAT